MLNPNEDLFGCNIVAKFIMGDQCEFAKTNASYMKNSTCIKKKFQNRLKKKQ